MPPRAKQVARRVRAQPTATDIEISNQRAAELTAARAEIERIRALVAAARNQLNDAINDTNAAMNNPARRRAAWNRIMDATNDLTRALQPTAPQQVPARTDMCERCGLRPTCGMSVSYNGSWPPTHLCRPCYDAETQPQQPHAFTGQGNRLDE